MRNTTSKPQPVRRATQLEAASTDAVCDAMTPARLRPDQITEAVSSDTKPTVLAEGSTETHALDKAHLHGRFGAPALGRPEVANRRARAARHANAPAATHKPTYPLAMRWSTGPDGRLSCTWHGPAHDRMREAIAA